MAKNVKVGSKVARGVLSALFCSSLAFAPVVLSGCAQEKDYDKELEDANRNLEISTQNVDKAQEDLDKLQDEYESMYGAGISKGILDSWHAVYAYVNLNDPAKYRVYDEDALKIVNLDLTLKITQDSDDRALFAIWRGSKSEAGQIDCSDSEHDTYDGLEGTGYWMKDSSGTKTAILFEPTDFKNTLIYMQDDVIYIYSRDNAQQDDIAAIKDYFE